MSEFLQTEKQSFRQRIRIRMVKLLDVLLVTGAFAFTWHFYYQGAMTFPFFEKGNWVVVGLFFVLYYRVAHLYHGFLIHIERITELIYSQSLAALITDGLLWIVICLINRRMITLLPLLLTLCVQVILLSVWSVWAHRWYFSHFPAKKTAVIYDERPNVDRLIHTGGLDGHFEVVRVLSIEEFRKRSPEDVLNGIEIVFLGDLHSHDRNQIIKYCVEYNIAAYVLPRVGDVIMSGAMPLHLLHLPMMMVERYNPTPEYLFFKRLFDILLSAIAIAILWPLMLVLAIIIKATDGGTVLYRQTRLTKNGKPFRLLKFRSMRMDAEKDGVARLSTGDSDPRVTKIGRFMRRCRLDELPQLFNILRGDVAIVGPRPERPEISAGYAKILPSWNLRLQCKCGLTGYAQVYGQYNTTPYDKLLMDLMYIAHPSLAQDLRIIFATVKILFLPESTEGIEAGQTTAMTQDIVNYDKTDTIYSSEEENEEKTVQNS